MKRHGIGILAMLLSAFALSAALYPQLDQEMAVHWDAQGQVDGRMDKGVGAFLMPMIMVLLAFFLLAVPRVDPLRSNMSRFEGAYAWFVVLILLFLLLIHIQTLLWGIGVEISPLLTMPIGLGALLICLGSLLEDTRRNWFIGIRTPWTMSSDEVWAKTHRLGGKLFRISGLIAMSGVFFKELSISLMLAPVILSSIWLAAYSYLEYRKEEGAQPPDGRRRP